MEDLLSALSDYLLESGFQDSWYSYEFNDAEQSLDQLSATAGGGDPKRGDAFLIGGIRIRTGTKEEVGSFEVVEIGRPVQCRRAVSVRCINVHLLLQQGS